MIFKINNITLEIELPFLQFGTWKLTQQQEIDKCLKYCQKYNIKLIDCAYEYENEKLIGKYFKEHKEYQSLITTKLWNSFHQPEMVQKQFQQSLENLGKIDLFVIHWPVSFKNININNEKETIVDNCQLYPRINGIIQKSNCSLYQTWRAMEDLVKQNKVKYIGVSNYCVGLLEDLLCYSEIKPLCNQIEANLYFQNTNLILYCINHQVHVCIYSPFGGNYDYGNNKQISIANDKIVQNIALKHNISAYDVQLLWHKHRFDKILNCEQRKSQNEQNIKHNQQLSEQDENILDSDDFKQLQNLDKNMRFNDAGKVFWDAPVFD